MKMMKTGESGSLTQVRHRIIMVKSRAVLYCYWQGQEDEIFLETRERRPSPRTRS